MDSELTDTPEDGEIVDYEPLPRPSVASSVKQTDSFRSDRETGTSDSSDSSDSDGGGISRKKPKIRKNDSSRSKYNVWATDFQTSELMDEICNWETGLKNRVMDKSRSVESYYHLPEEKDLGDSHDSDVRKRRHGEVVDLREKLGRRQSIDKDDIKSRPRYLSELRITLDDSIEDITQDITSKLCEEKEDLVLRVVTILGKEKAIEMFKKTKDLEEGGGMMVMNGSRRRTPGGVFLQLIKRDEEISKDEKKKIFIEEQRVAAKCKKSKSKQHLRKDSEIKESMLDNAEEDLPPLFTRQEIALSVAQSNDCDPCMDDSAPSAVPAAEPMNQRQITVYEDNLFDDGPCEVEFT